ncbi:MAG TPA: FAD:protein FMN transferase [Candidatus Polarisedimenticolaceae bacterium]|nr:FAD:protein FMN transferase [Candidatus Polarisedimenticolaceae bacterium]
MSDRDAAKSIVPLGRRDLLRILAVGGGLGAAWTVGWVNRKRAVPVSRSAVLMGTRVNLTVMGDDRDAADAAARVTLGRMAELESLLSRHRPDSELSRLNAAGRIDGASDALIDLLGLAHDVSAAGAGAFDVSMLPLLDVYRDPRRRWGELPAPDEIEHALERVDYRQIRVDTTTRRVSLLRDGMRLTLDGIAKGYIVDRGVDVLRERGFANVFVEAGGDLMASGDKGGLPWRIGIRDPRASGLTLCARFDTTNRAVATSGDYMQPFTRDLTQHHILDPRTGYSSPELASSTVIARDAATADALATLTMVLGPRRGRELLESLAGCEGYFVAKDLEVTRTSGFSVA